MVMKVSGMTLPVWYLSHIRDYAVPIIIHMIPTSSMEPQYKDLVMVLLPSDWSRAGISLL